MMTTRFKIVKSSLGHIFRNTIRTNCAVWFCGNLAECPVTGLCRDVAIELNDLERSMRYIERMAERFPWILVPGEVAAARRWNHFYPLVSCDGDPAGYIKIAIGQAYVEDFDEMLSLRDDEAFVCDTFLAPEFRGRGLSKVLLAESIAWLRQKGVEYLFCHIPEWNSASLGLFRGFGFRRIRKVRHMRVLGKRFYTVHPAKILASGRMLRESVTIQSERR
jgi:GNAT superfamily N-acetyltransferase